jgi:hypothetical protein
VFDEELKVSISKATVSEFKRGSEKYSSVWIIGVILI